MTTGRLQAGMKKSSVIQCLPPAFPHTLFICLCQAGSMNQLYMIILPPLQTMVDPPFSHSQTPKLEWKLLRTTTFLEMNVVGVPSSMR